MSLKPQVVPNATLLLPVLLADGGSRPRVYDFDDHVFRLVKWQPSAHGLTSTCSELAASRLGQLFEAPLPRAAVVWIDPQLIPNDVNAAGGFHVGFAYLPGSNFRASDYAHLKNTAALPAAAVQLAWLGVGDQQGHNQYLWNAEVLLPDGTTRKMNHFTLVDQAAMFGSHDWSATGPGTSNAPYTLPQDVRDQLTFDQLEPTLIAVDSLDADDIAACFSDWNGVWGVDQGLVDAAVAHLCDRRSHLRDVLRANWP